jgi:hypothetical protein
MSIPHKGIEGSNPSVSAISFQAIDDPEKPLSLNGSSISLLQILLQNSL